MDKAVECTNASIKADTYDYYIGAELQLPKYYIIKWMARVYQILHDADVNSEVTGNYRVWTDHTKYKTGFIYGSTSKLTANDIYENMFSMVDSEGRQSQLLE